MRFETRRRHDDLAQSLAGGFCPRPTKHGFGLWAPVTDDAVFVELQKCIKCSVDDTSRHLFAIVKSLFGFFLLGDVPINCHSALQHACFVPNWTSACNQMGARRCSLVTDDEF